MAFKGTWSARSKILLDGKIIEVSLSEFNYLGCKLSYKNEENINGKINKPDNRNSPKYSKTQAKGRGLNKIIQLHGSSYPYLWLKNVDNVS